MRAALEAHFLRRAWRVDTAGNAEEALGKFRPVKHPLIVTDIRMPGADGFTVMREARSLAPQTAVILLTAYGSVPDAVEAMKGGACDYLVKPVSFERLEQAAERILTQAQSLAQNHDRGNEDRTGEGLVGQSPLWRRALARARQAAASDADVLIEAESGTGKELVARLIHRLSPRRERAFVALNCAAFPESLLESELFGYSRGAFTGATMAKPGRFELANRGTLLLDEIGEMPLGLQPKLLRVLQEREFDRLGDTRPVRVDLRVISTTNRALAEMVREGKFRADLYYRLNVIALSLPPLRERKEDIRELAGHFVRLYAKPGRRLSLGEPFLTRLEHYSWPGNVRELANCVRRAVALAVGEEIGAEGLENLGDSVSRPSRAMSSGRAAVGEAAGVGHPPLDRDASIGDRLRPGVSLENMERRLFEMTLEANQGNRSRTAESLGVSLRTVRNKIRSYGLPARSSYGRD